ncbi:MAG: tRNA (adenine-N1)-methyltransferase [Candidatus Nanopelagicales bacterium]|nr:tRNA (adenine-N1)-methyltransferase [Candidatus Nanopelagicales bacterium]
MSSAEFRKGPFREGDLVQLTDPKGKLHTLTLTPGKVFHTHRGGLAHDDLIGLESGSVITASGGSAYLALRPLLDDFVLSMPRGAAVVYPKDAARIVGLMNLHPGSRIAEAGVGSGALTCSLLKAVGSTGRVFSFERREEFAKVAEGNVETWFGQRPEQWTLTLGDLTDALQERELDAVVLDMLAPWECLETVAAALCPGGVLVGYVATTTQLSKLVETLRLSGHWTEPRAEETMLRTWHLDGLSVRPDHRMNGHTGFLVSTRRLAPGAVLPPRRRRPAPGAYGEDYSGPGAARADSVESASDELES